MHASKQEQSFADFVAKRFAGRLYVGTHEMNADGKACALEAWSAYHTHTWTDNPTLVGCFDMRHLNDIPVAPKLRAHWMVPVVCAYAGSLAWSLSQQHACLGLLVLRTVQHLLPKLPGLEPRVIAACRHATTLAEAELASREVGCTPTIASCLIRERSANMSLYGVNKSVVGCSGNIARVAAYVASSDFANLEYRTERAARAAVFIQACQFWIQVAEECAYDASAGA